MGKQGINISIFPGRKWRFRGVGELTEGQRVSVGIGIFNLVSSQSHCVMSLPKVTDKCDTEVTGCHSPPSSPDAGGGKEFRKGLTGPWSPVLRTTIHLTDALGEVT